MLKIEDFKSGEYRNQGDFKSFIPSKINDLWTWESHEINFLLAQASKELGALNSYSELVPDIDIYIRMHIQVEANRSNRIEGTMTSVEEDLLPPEDLQPEKRDDAAEVNNYIKAMNYGIKRIVDDDFPLASRLIRELHAILLEGVRGDHKTPGEFRMSQNFIGGSMPSNAVYVPPAVCDLDEAMNDFDKFINSHNDVPSLIRLAILHYQFETIHPFLDGNGRIGRLLIPLYLLASKELVKPCFYISEFFESHRTEYYDSLQRARLHNDLKGWVCFFLKASIATSAAAKEKFRLAVVQVQKYKDYLMDKKTSASSLKTILEAMYKTPVTSATQLSNSTGLSFSTVARAIKILEEDKIIFKYSEGNKNRIYVLKEYLEIFKRDMLF